MGLVFQTGSLASGEQRTHTVNNRVKSAGVALQEYTVGYELPPAEPEPVPADGDPDVGKDHHVLEVEAGVVIVTTGDETVTVKAEGEIVDSSGSRGGAKIGYVLIVETD